MIGAVRRGSQPEIPVQPGRYRGLVLGTVNAVGPPAARTVGPGMHLLDRTDSPIPYPFTKLADIANRYVASDGFVTNRTEALENQDKALQRRMEEMQQRLDRKEASLRRQFVALEITLQKLNAQSAWLTQQMNTLSALRYE